MKLLNKIKDKKRQGGYNMVELLLVMAVIVTLTAILIMGLYSAASTHSHEHETVAQVSNIRQAVQEYYANADADTSQADFSTNWSGLNSYGIDKNLLGKNGLSANPFGGDYSIAVRKPQQGQFQVSIKNVPPRVINNTSFINQLSRLGSTVESSAGRHGNQSCVVDNSTITCTYAD